MKNVKTKALTLVILSVGGGGAVASEWNFNEDDFNKTGQVTLKTPSGQAINVDNTQSANAYSISNSPTVVNVKSSGGSGGSSGGGLPLLSDKVVLGTGQQKVSKYEKGDTLEIIIPFDCLVEGMPLGFTAFPYHTGDNPQSKVTITYNNGGLSDELSSTWFYMPAGSVYPKYKPRLSHLNHTAYYLPSGAIIKTKATKTCSPDYGQSCYYSNQITCHRL